MKQKLTSRAKIASLRTTMIKLDGIVHELDELMSQFLDNVKYVTKRLRLALPLNKREMVDIFCENLVWKDGKLRWDLKKPYFFIAKQPKDPRGLPLLDSFRNRKIELNIPLADIKVFADQIKHWNISPQLKYFSKSSRFT